MSKFCGQDVAREHYTSEISDRNKKKILCLETIPSYNFYMSMCRMDKFNVVRFFIQ